MLKSQLIDKNLLKVLDINTILYTRLDKGITIRKTEREKLALAQNKKIGQSFVVSPQVSQRRLKI